MVSPNHITPNIHSYRIPYHARSCRVPVSTMHTLVSISKMVSSKTNSISWCVKKSQLGKEEQGAPMDHNLWWAGGRAPLHQLGRGSGGGGGGQTPTHGGQGTPAAHPGISGCAAGAPLQLSWGAAEHSVLEPDTLEWSREGEPRPTSPEISPVLRSIGRCPNTTTRAKISR